MRIAAGEARGVRLKGPRSRREARATSSRVRNAIFNMLPPEAVEEARALDAYAGTGALGLEALSRGARWVDFVERNPEMCRRLKQNVESAGLQDKAHVYCATIEKAATFLNGPYDLVLMDPPYEQAGIEGIMGRVSGAGLLRHEGLMVVEHAARNALPESVGALSLFRRRCYGDTAVSFYRQERAS